MHDPDGNGDWIKIHRKICESACFFDLQTLQVWIWLLCHANWERRQLLDGTVLNPGQLVIGQDRLAAALRSTRMKVRVSLEKLKSCGNITSKATNHGTIVTISNWGTYQKSAKAPQPATKPTDNQRITSKQPTDNQRITTEEEGKKERTKEGKKKRPSPSANGSASAFDEFWAAVHLKVGKRKAEDAFNSAVKRICVEHDVEPIAASRYVIDAMKEFAASPASRPTDHTPIHPTTWLNSGRYDDDRSTWRGQQGQGRKAGSSLTQGYLT